MGDREVPNTAYKNWVVIMEDLLCDDLDKQRVAFLELQRLITNLLSRLSGWGEREQELRNDLRQTILLKLVNSFRGGQLREPKAFVDYVRTVTRNAFYDTLRARGGQEEVDIEENLSELTSEPVAPPVDRETQMSLQLALQRLPERERQVVEAVYIQGFTYDEAVAETMIPLGSLKRYLRQGLSRLREQLDEALSRGDPILPRAPSFKREDTS